MIVRCCYQKQYIPRLHKCGPPAYIHNSHIGNLAVKRPSEHCISLCSPCKADRLYPTSAVTQWILRARCLLSSQSEPVQVDVTMHCREYPTDLKLHSPLPRIAKIWLGVALFIASLYIVRASIEVIPPEDHFALSVLLCFLLGQVLLSIEQSVLKISLPYNRAWLHHRSFGRYHERSLPVSQIHSARLEFSKKPHDDAPDTARIVLVTALGMIPVSEKYQKNPKHLGTICRQINSFLESQEGLLKA